MHGQADSSALADSASKIDTTYAPLLTLITNHATGYTTEEAQDAVGAMATASLEYTDATPSLQLDGDSDTPGNSKLYGTNSSGTKGWTTSRPVRAFRLPPSRAKRLMGYHLLLAPLPLMPGRIIHTAPRPPPRIRRRSPAYLRAMGRMFRRLPRGRI